MSLKAQSQELDKMRQAFEQMDTDHDGTLTETEIIKAIEGISGGMAGSLGSKPSTDSLLKNIDSD